MEICCMRGTVEEENCASVSFLVLLSSSSSSLFPSWEEARTLMVNVSMRRHGKFVVNLPREMMRERRFMVEGCFCSHLSYFSENRFTSSSDIKGLHSHSLLLHLSDLKCLFMSSQVNGGVGWRLMVTFISPSGGGGKKEFSLTMRTRYTC